MPTFPLHHPLIRLSSVLLLFFTSLAFSSDDPVNVSLVDSLTLDRPAEAGEATLIVVRPNGEHLTFEYSADQPLTIDRTMLSNQALEDGLYVFEIRFRPLASQTLDLTLLESRSDGQPTGAVASVESHSGVFRISDGAFMEGTAEDSLDLPSTGTRDYVVNDDLIVTGSGCFGFDCIDGEVFVSDTLRIKENNTRLTFIDTSAVAGFAAGDWQLRANDSANGGADHFSIDWLGTNAANGDTPVSTPFRVDGAAPNNALRVAETGRIGLRTATPVLDLHIATNNTPGIRLDQTSAGGFSPQVWDLAGNEANFFVRDVTNGSRLPFRIRPGAPTSSIDIAASGNVGVGISSPAAKLHVANGDLRVDGSIYQLSSRALKSEFGRIDPSLLLDLVGNLTLGTWRYLHNTESGPHFGPAAEDFHAAFGLGDSDDSISIADMAGVALGAVQALKHELDERDREIASLNIRLERLEQALLAGEDK